MLIKIFVCGPLQNNTFVITCEQTKKSAVIDPSFGSNKKITTFLFKKGFNLDKILLTHSHWDHIADVQILKKESLAPVYVHKLDAENLENPSLYTTFSMFPVEGTKADKFLQDNEKIDVGLIEISTIHTPGHTPGGVCFYVEKEKILFSGDTLFKGSFGRVDFPYSNAEDMINSLKKLSKLPKEVKVYPGHGLDTTILDQSWMKEAAKFI